MTLLFGVMRLHAQDTTQVYPWRLSYFPYVTASPNDGVMGLARVVFFRQSRWDDRVSLHSSVAVEGGYSTKDSWVARVRGNFPRLADGWRLQVIGEAARYAEYNAANAFGQRATRQAVSAELTRAIGPNVYVAVRGSTAHLNVPYDSTLLAIYTSPPGDVTENDARGRIALVYDGRDREYDTRRGLFVQVGFFVQSQRSATGAYGLVSGWLPVDERTRLTARIGVQAAGEASSEEARRSMPAWEDEFVLGGGWQSNRGLAIGEYHGVNNALVSAELRHDLKVFPGGAVAVLAFVDASRSYCAACFQGWPGPVDHSGDWKVSPGAGVSLRLLRNAILTATVARAEAATRFYVSSGWSW